MAEGLLKRFVVQQHIREGDVHWDLMLESGHILKTWRLDTSPEHIGNEPISAEKISDHDVKFLTYQGIVNKGLGRVSIIDEGIIETIGETEQTIRLHLHGKILSGDFVLEYLSQDQWRFIRI
jgi:bifunctional non-homologous end joining protein LigD